MTTAVHQVEKFVGWATAKPFGARLWIEDGPIKVYVRHGKRYLAGSYRPTLTLATIEVEEDHQREGRCTELLQGCMKLCKARGEALLIESVINPHLERLLEREGFIMSEHAEADWFRLAESA